MNKISCDAMRCERISGKASLIHSRPGALEWFSNGITSKVCVPGACASTTGQVTTHAVNTRKTRRRLGLGRKFSKQKLYRLLREAKVVTLRHSETYTLMRPAHQIQV